MRSILSIATLLLLPLGVISTPVACPVPQAVNSKCNADNCARSVTGTAQKTPSLESRREDCSSFMLTTVTPALVYEYTTISDTSSITTSVTDTSYATATATTSSTSTTLITRTITETVYIRTEYEPISTETTSTSTFTSIYTVRKRDEALAPEPTIVIPSDVPSYAFWCSGTARYASACSCWGITASVSTAAVPTTTITAYETTSPVVSETDYSTITITETTTFSSTETSTIIEDTTESATTTSQITISTYASSTEAFACVRTPNIDQNPGFEEDTSFSNPYPWDFSSSSGSVPQIVNNDTFIQGNSAFTGSQFLEVRKLDKSVPYKFVLKQVVTMCPGWYLARFGVYVRCDSGDCSCAFRISFGSNSRVIYPYQIDAFEFSATYVTAEGNIPEFSDVTLKVETEGANGCEADYLAIDNVILDDITS